MARYRVRLAEIVEREVEVDAPSSSAAAYCAKDRRNWLDTSDPQHWVDVGEAWCVDEDEPDCMTAYKDREENQ